LYRRLTEVQSLSTITPLLMGVFVYARHTPDCPKRADRFCYTMQLKVLASDDAPFLAFVKSNFFKVTATFLQFLNEP
jgi:hypothetical protein